MTTEIEIGDEAIEAGARACWEADRAEATATGDEWPAWEDADPDDRDPVRDAVRVVLTAAAPILRAHWEAERLDGFGQEILRRARADERAKVLAEVEGALVELSNRIAARGDHDSVEQGIGVAKALRVLGPLADVLGTQGPDRGATAPVPRDAQPLDDEALRHMQERVNQLVEDIDAGTPGLRFVAGADRDCGFTPSSHLGDVLRQRIADEDAGVVIQLGDQTIWPRPAADAGDA